MKLETPRLILRELTTADQEAVHTYASDPDTTQYLDWGPNMPGETQAFLARAIGFQTEAPRAGYVFGVTLKESGLLIGHAGLRAEHDPHRRGELGYLFNRAHWGHGYATEAASEVIVFAFEQLRLHRVQATCFAENRASTRVLTKLGMKLEGRMKDAKFIKGAFRDVLVYAVVR